MEVWPLTLDNGGCGGGGGGGASTSRPQPPPPPLPPHIAIHITMMSVFVSVRVVLNRFFHF